jgi:hypothetical protein
MKMRIVREESIRKNSGEVQLYVVFVLFTQRHYQTLVCTEYLKTSHIQRSSDNFGSFNIGLFVPLQFIA